VPRDVASRAAKERCDAGYGVGTGLAVFLDLKDAILKQGQKVIEAKYGNLFQMYEKIVDDDPYKMPMMIYPAIHYTMGGLWVDYELMTNIPGLFAIGEANFSDHGANRLGASALMQGLADGYFVLPYTIQNYLANDIKTVRIPVTQKEFTDAEKSVKDRMERLLNIKGKHSVDSFHKRLGKIMWDNVGMSRNEESLKKAIKEIRLLREEFWMDVKVSGELFYLNPELEKAARLADFLEAGELIAMDALHRKESCGGHFREEYQTPEGEALRNDKEFTYVAAWEYKGPGLEPELHKEELEFKFTEVKQRDYK
jgi:succinate dehydrogenase / fumarate reductase flavoprotein subunit